MSRIVYSIIIPHKNIPKLLQRCLDSIPNREDIEIIIVDDNSDPKIVSFSDFPGKDKKNTTIIYDKKGGGAGYAKNIGLKIAQGEKLIFADSDDFFNYCVNEILEKYKSRYFDVAYFNISAVDCFLYTNSDVDRLKYLNSLFEVYKKDRTKGLNLLRFYMGAPWAKIINKSLVDRYNLRFDETPICDDEIFAYMLGFYASKFLVEDVALYCVTTRPGSIMFSELSEEKILAKTSIISKRELFYKKHSISSQDKFNALSVILAKLKRDNQLEFYAKCANIVKEDGHNIQEIEQEVRQIISEERKRQLRSRIKKTIKKIIRI